MKHTPVREFLEEAFSYLDLDWKEFVGFDKKYERPAEVDLLIGDPSKAKNQVELGAQNSHFRTRIDHGRGGHEVG